MPRKKRAQEGPQKSFDPFLSRTDHAWGEVLLAPGDATGGQGLPGVGLIPGLLGEVPFWLLGLPGADGFELDDPAFGVVLGAPLVVPGKVPHGEPLGELPGFVGVLGLMVDGCVVLPGVGVAGEFDPGTVVFGVRPGVAPGVLCGVVVPAGGVAVPTGGVAVPAGGVAVLAGGVAVLAGGVAGDPGVEVCPADPGAPLGGTAPPEGVDCATAQLAQQSTTESNVSFDVDI